MKQISLFIPLLGTLLLSGCAGTNTEFECNATTSDKGAGHADGDHAAPDGTGAVR